MSLTAIFLSLFFWSSAPNPEPANACEYAGSNIGFITSQTRKAIDADDINRSKYYAYRALNAIERSKNQFEDCGCEYAVKNINESLANLILATRTTSLEASRILLERALENALGSLEAIETHHLHNSQYASDVLAVNTKEVYNKKLSMRRPHEEKLRQKIDSSLVNFENSLENMIGSFDCKETMAYVMRTREHCQKQLLKPNLTEGKKYYNLKTKEILDDALTRLNDCQN